MVQKERGQVHLSSLPDGATSASVSFARLPSGRARLRRPLAALLAEALAVADFCERRAAEAEEASAIVSKPMAERIRAWVASVREEHARYLGAHDATHEPAALRRRAKEVSDELLDVLRWHASKSESLRAALQPMAKLHWRDSSATLAMRLALLVELARQLPRADLDAVLQSAGDSEILDTAGAMASELKVAPRAARQLSTEARAALDRRDDALVAMAEAIREVRVAARFAFRRRPEVVREVMERG